MTTTTDITYRTFGKDADAAVAVAVNKAGRDGHDIYDVKSARRAPRTSDEFVVVLRVMVR